MNLFSNLTQSINYQWTRWNGYSNGDGDQRAESATILIPTTTTMPLPRRCPKCKSVRWNQRYLDQELALIDRLQDELYETGLIKESGEKIVYEGSQTLGTKPRTVFPYDYDFIAYDFLKQIIPVFLHNQILGSNILANPHSQVLKDKKALTKKNNSNQNNQCSISNY